MQAWTYNVFQAWLKDGYKFTYFMMQLIARMSDMQRYARQDDYMTVPAEYLEACWKDLAK